MKILTAPQRIAFKRELMEPQVARRIKGAVLTKAQAAKLDALYTENADGISEDAPGMMEVDAAAKLVAQRCYDSILSDAQRRQVDEQSVSEREPDR